MRKEERLGQRWLNAMGIKFRKPFKYEPSCKCIAILTSEDSKKPLHFFTYEIFSWKHMLFGSKEEISLPAYIKHIFKNSSDRHLVSRYMNDMLNFKSIEELDLLLTLAGKNYD